MKKCGSISMQWTNQISPTHIPRSFFVECSCARHHTICIHGNTALKNGDIFVGETHPTRSTIIPYIHILLLASASPGYPSAYGEEQSRLQHAASIVSVYTPHRSPLALDVFNMDDIQQTWRPNLRTIGRHVRNQLGSIGATCRGGSSAHRSGEDAAPPSTTLPYLQQHQQELQSEMCRTFCYFSQTPVDVRPLILSYLGARELCGVRRASWDLLQEADRHTDELWSLLCRRDFPSVWSPHAQDEQMSFHQVIVRGRKRRELAHS